VQTGEAFYSDLIDSRVAPLKRNNMRLIDMFRMYGLQNLREACGGNNEEQIPLLKDRLRIDYKRAHPWMRDDKGKPVMGCPMLFFFDGRVDAAVAEIENIPSDPSEGAKAVIDKSYPHDFIDTAKYWASDGPSYMGKVEYEQHQERIGGMDRNDGSNMPFTGY
jgi:hypothetical protein